MGTTFSVTEPEDIPLEQRRACLPGGVNVDGIVQLIKDGKVKRVACLCGAGISVSAGIPDFRSPQTGLYHRLQEYGLPTPESIFDLGFFESNPRPFYKLAAEMFPGAHKPTATHAFMRLLQDKGLLLRCYTQNIDTLERAAGIQPEKLVEAHGSFATASCIDCKCRVCIKSFRDAIESGRPVPCCSNVVSIPR